MAISKKIAILLVTGLALMSCKPDTQTVVKYVCVPLIPYSKDFQAALDREVAQLEAPYLFQILNDYGITRDAIRKCINKRDSVKKKNERR
jgi:hypothetical protein